MQDRFLRADVGDPTRRFLEAFEGISLRERVRRIWTGLHAPRDSGYRKYAYAELQHVCSWIAAWIVPLILLLLMHLAASPPPAQAIPGPVVMVPPPDKALILDPLPERSDSEPLSFGSHDIVQTAAFDPPLSEAAPNRDILPTPHTQSPPVVLSKSPVLIPLPFRDTGLGRRKGNALTIRTTPGEDAVTRALRWLKAEQRGDGSWGDPPPAMTGLAVLCFLGRGEIPGNSEAFGDTVRRGIDWLLDNQTADGRFARSDGHEYSLPIAAYALCEAFALTRVPRVRDAAERSIRVLVEGQNPSGGWNYNCRPSDRNDTSYMGWCVQALKAAQIAGVGGADLQPAMKRAVSGFRGNAHADGGFGYTAPGQSGLTGAGVLSMQMLGAANSGEARRGLLWLDCITMDWDQPWGQRPLYYWYYTTQAFFNARGKGWTRWDGCFVRELAENQQVTTCPSTGQPVGHWTPPAGLEQHGLVYSTTLCTLMLEVYYRYLPTYRLASEPADDDSAKGDEGIKVGVKFPDV